MVRIKDSLRTVVVRLSRTLSEDEALALLLEHFPEAVIEDHRNQQRVA